MMPATAARRVRAPYPPGEFYDEAIAPDGALRPGYGEVLEALEDASFTEAASAVARRSERTGATFGGEPFAVDAVPRLIGAGEWEWLERALAQRARALNAFIADVYGDRAIVRAGVVDAAAVTGAEHFEPAMMGLEAPAGHAPVIGYDLVRGADGRLKVLEDNLRTPSGLAYAVAARRAVEPVLAAVGLPPRLSPDACFDALRDALMRSAPGQDGPNVVLLTDGSRNTAWYEHRTLARRLGIPVVRPEKLRLHEGYLCRVFPSGRPQRIDVVYRRTDEDRLRDQHGRPTWLGEVLLDPLRRGRLAVVNAPGTGVADDKLIHAYVEEMIRFYLGQEPLIESVRTYDLTRPEMLTRALGRIAALVVKPRTGHGGIGVVVCPHATAEDRARVAATIRAAPHRFVAQEAIRLSRHPTACAGRLEPRHVDLRVFAIGTGPHTTIVPAPLTRVALDRGDLIVNSSQGGGCKDTWIFAGFGD